ncbi:hypothetical protein IPF86_01680 [Candidatus Nomurabacteria bacterium]|nr:MAG: hypothetical protein IPF86_01680 [Candidatus Nomurabacteria bacterium]
MKKDVSEILAFVFAKIVGCIFFGWLTYLAGILVVLAVLDDNQNLFSTFGYSIFCLGSLIFAVFFLAMSEEDLRKKRKDRNTNWRNLAPKLCRQRIIIEAITDHCVTPEEFKDYLLKLSHVVGMRLLEHGKDPNPSAYDAENMGYGGWIHWVTSGAHMYSYPAEVTGGAGHLLSVDAYTCKPFSVEKAVKFTREYFKPKDIVWREF